MGHEESTAAFKRFSESARLDDTRFRYMNDPFFKGFVRLLSSMLGESITPQDYFEVCEDLLSMAALNPMRSQKDVESLVTRLVVYMQGCPPVTPKLFSDRFTNATITLFARRYLQGSSG